MKQMRKKTLDKATESLIARAALAGTPLPFDRYEDMSPVCRFGQMGLDCKACTQGPCRINPFAPSNGTVCGRQREDIVAAGFLSLISNGAAMSASYAGAQARVAGTVFQGLALANEGNAGSRRMLSVALEVARAGYDALASVAGESPTPKATEIGLGALKPDRVNILLLGSIPPHLAARAGAELGANPAVNLVAGAGSEGAGFPVAGNYNSQELLLASACVDGVVAGGACVAPGFLAEAARQGVPVVNAADLDVPALLAAADAHFRMNQGRNLAEKWTPARAVAGFSAGAFSHLSSAHWGRLAAMGLKGVAILGGCNNAASTQDALVVRMAQEFLSRDVLVIAGGCAGAGLGKAGYMDPARREGQAGKKLSAFLAAMSEAAGLEIPAVLGTGSCWNMPAALELAMLLEKELSLPVFSAMPEISRPAAWSTALALASLGVPTYVGPVLPLDGGLETVSLLNELLKPAGGMLLGPGQVESPEAFANVALSLQS